MKHMRGIFGSDLTGVCKALNRCPPFVVGLCVAEIESRGLHHEGLYRVSPSSEELDTLRFTLDQDMEATNLGLYPDVHVVCGVLKLYFRLLPVPLVPYDSYGAVVASVRELPLSPVPVPSVHLCLRSRRVLPLQRTTRTRRPS